MQQCVKALNHLYTSCPALYELQFDPKGFEWIDMNHRAESVVSYRRKGKDPEDDLLIVLNLTPVVRHNWKINVYGKSSWKEVYNSDSKDFWGTGDVFNPNPKCEEIDKTTGLYEITIHLPALGGVIFK
ncbi:MAG: alpha amylase C-terminal domain-containing protein [Ferruginibacter sp.]